MFPAEPASAMAGAIHDGDHSPVPDSALATASTPNPTPDAHLKISPPRIPQPLDAFEFWDALFPQALAYLIAAHPQEPERLVKLGWRVRDKRNWTEVFDQIESAANDCFKSDKKLKGRFRKVYRKFGEDANRTSNISKLVPAGGDMGAVPVTPIIGCVQILLEV